MYSPHTSGLDSMDPGRKPSAGLDPGRKPSAGLIPGRKPSAGVDILFHLFFKLSFSWNHFLKK